MGSTLMATPLQHRASADSAKAEFSVAASGFYSATDERDNVSGLNAGGGNLSATFRASGVASWFFVNAAVGGFGGSMNFACSEAKCRNLGENNREYSDWLKTSEGGADYSFWNVQERVLAGVDLNVGPYLILGGAGGVQLFQGGGEYDDMRAELDEQNVVDDLDGSSGTAGVMSVWLGSHFGRHGQYGNFVVEYDLYFKGDLSYSMKYTYTHPTGFFAGVAEGSLMAFTVYAGKEFVF